MSLRHLSRQPDREPRLHDPHLNGAAAPPNGAPHPASLVSPTTAPAPVSNGNSAPNPATSSAIHKLTVANEQTWLLIGPHVFQQFFVSPDAHSRVRTGRVAEQMGDLEHALSAYENALRHNPLSLSGLTQVAGIARIKENYPKAVEFFQRVLGLQEENGEVWSALGHCYLMQDDLQKAYSAYQQALYLLPNPKEDPKLWYGIGILYDRYGSLDHAEEAFSSVLRMDKDFDKANEILTTDSLGCFDRILRNPPSPLAHADIWFQIGHVYEQQKDHVSAKDAYERVVTDNPSHAKVLQQLGWLYHQDGSTFQNQDLAIQYLTKSLEADPSDAQSWYLLGRAYMAGQKYNKAYEAYQQAVYRDGRNPTFWCSIGVLYFQINQYRDALDAYSRAIRINPYISEVWFDLGSLYESCNNQISDAIDAYARASELDPNNPFPAAPGPQDVHPTAYASAVVPPPGQRPVFRTDSRGPPAEISLPPPSQVGAGRSSPGPFRGGPPPPVILDESRHMPSASSAREPPSRLLLHHPVPQQQIPAEEIRNGGHHHQESYFTRGHRPPSTSISPPSHSTRIRSPPPPSFQSYPSSSRGQPPLGPAHEQIRTADPPEMGWERRPPPSEHRDWNREHDARRPPRHSSSGEYSTHPPQSQSSFYPPRSPGPHRGRSPPESSPRSAHPSHPPPSRYWDAKPPTALPSVQPPPHPRTSPQSAHAEHSRRYDPRYDARDREHRDSYEAERPQSASRSYAGSPEGIRNPVAARNPPPHLISTSTTRSESPHPASAAGGPSDPKNRRRSTKDVEAPVSAASAASSQEQQQPKKERKKRSSKRKEDGGGRAETPKSFGGPSPHQSSGASTSYKVSPGYPKGPSSPGPLSSNGSGSSGRAAPRMPSRPGVADALMGLASYREMPAPSMEGGVPTSQSPTVSSGSRHSDRDRPNPSHRDSVSSTRSRASPPTSSPSDDGSENKRSRMDVGHRRDSSSGGRRTPIPSTRPSPIPFRTQPASHSPETRDPYPASPPLPAVFPPHPRPVGAVGLSSSAHMIAPIALPPIATLSPTRDREDNKMQVDSHHSVSPPPRAKVEQSTGTSSTSSPLGTTRECGVRQTCPICRQVFLDRL
ncbi:TPR-like protein [Mycena rebaudengoi]|nr:TPR-like protein [Mycena rebaudengoi]